MPDHAHAFPTESATPEAMLRLRDVIARTGLSRPTIYRHIRLGIFPRNYQIGLRPVGWRLSEIEKWLADRAAG